MPQGCRPCTVLRLVGAVTEVDESASWWIQEVQSDMNLVASDRQVWMIPWMDECGGIPA